MTEMAETGRLRDNLQTPKFYKGVLHALMVQRLPELVRGGRIDTLALSRTTGNARFTCYRWLNEDKLSPAAARALLRIARGRITAEELTPFLLA